MGEYESVNALATGSVSSTAKAWSWVGLWAALIAVTVPLLFVVGRAFSFFPFIAYWKTVRKNAESIETIYTDWSNCEAWFDSHTTFRRVSETNPGKWVGAGNFNEFKTQAWGDLFPEHRGTVVLDDKRVIVFDRVGDRKGATFFEVEHQKLKEMVAYDSRDQAVAANDPPRPLQAVLTLLAYRTAPQQDADADPQGDDGTL